MGDREFWLISPRENMVRVEKVEHSNTARLHQLCQLIIEQTGPAQQAAQQLMAQMAAHTQKEQADGVTEQLSKLGLSVEQQMSTGVPAAPKYDAAARFLRAIVSPQSGSSASTPINVQAMQVANPASTLYPAKFAPSSSLSTPATSRTHSDLLPRGLPCPTSFNGHSHQQSSGYSSPLSFPTPSTVPPPHHRRPPPHTSHYGAYNNSPLSVLSSLLTPRALHSMLAMNAGMLGVSGAVEEAQRGRRRRVRKKKNRSSLSSKVADKLDESGSSDAQHDEHTAHSDDNNNTDKEDDDSETADNQQQQQSTRNNQHSAAASV